METFVTSKEILDLHNEEHKMQTLLHSSAVMEQYKEVSEVINSFEARPKRRPKRSIKELMQESFFHGASWIGTNFIA